MKTTRFSVIALVIVAVVVIGFVLVNYFSGQQAITPHGLGMPEFGPRDFDTVYANMTILSFDAKPDYIRSIQVRINEIISYIRYENATYPALKEGDIIQLSINSIINSTRYIIKDCPKPITQNTSENETVIEGVLGIVCESELVHILTIEESRSYLSSLVGKSILNGINNCGNSCEEQIWTSSITIENPDIIIENIKEMDV